jgi:serine/threonine-protein kinase
VAQDDQAASAARWQRIKTLLYAALERSPHDRESFLDAACVGDEPLRQEIESLLGCESAPAPTVSAGPGATIASAGFSPGAVFNGRYRIVSLLGRGAVGEVYRADDLKLGQSVALKFFPAGLSGQPVLMARFMSEVRLARGITHPNVCRVHDIGEADGRHYLSMEYIDGEDLASLLRRIGRLPMEKVIQVARELCRALAAAHDRGVLHRDLKPANIMIDGRGHAHIMDFGIAVPIASARPGEIAGTPAYMAPEQLVGGVVSVQTDLFSLGLILYELFTGIRVFPVASLRERQQATEPADAVVTSGTGRGIDAALEALIVECLQSDPSKRPSSARAIAAALPGGGDPLAAALVAGQTPSPAMVAAAEDTTRLRPAAAWICFAAAVIGLLLVAWQMKGMMIYRQAPIAKPPDALVDRAQQIISKMGYTESAVDSAYWFAARGSDDDIMSDRTGLYEFTHRQSNIGSEDIVFVYRQSPRYLVSENSFAVVTYREPPADVPGMADVTLAPSGRLIRFTAVPGAMTQPPREADTFDWSAAFAEAELDHESADRAARVVTATSHGWPVLFDVAPQSAPTRNRTDERTRAQPLSQFMMVALTLAAIVGAAVLARRNIRQGRWDGSGALKVGSSVLVLGVSWGLLRANHVPFMREEYLLFSRVAGLSLFYGASLFLSYVAFEPLVRRRWPRVLTSWTRLLSGRFRDPLVGRDIVAGALIGIAVMLLWESEFVIANIFDLVPATRIQTPLAGLGSMRDFVGLALFAHLFAVQLALGWLLILLLMGIVFRSDRIAVIVSIVVTAPVTTLAGNHLALEICLGTIVTTLSTLGLLRFGLIALLVELWLTAILILLPISLDSADWYQARSILVLIGLLGVIGYAAYIAQSRDRLADPRA